MKNVYIISCLCLVLFLSASFAQNYTFTYKPDPDSYNSPPFITIQCNSTFHPIGYAYPFQKLSISTHSLNCQTFDMVRIGLMHSERSERAYGTCLPSIYDPKLASANYVITDSGYSHAPYTCNGS